MNAIPTEGVTPRASHTAQTMVCASPRPRTDDALEARDFRPDAVVGRLSEVNTSEWAIFGVEVDTKLDEECGVGRRADAGPGVDVLLEHTALRDRDESGVLVGCGVELPK